MNSRTGQLRPWKRESEGIAASAVLDPVRVGEALVDDDLIPFVDDDLVIFGTDTISPLAFATQPSPTFADDDGVSLSDDDGASFVL
jgi:hypothetical protein